MARPPKRLKKIVEAAESKGWTYDETREGHPRLTPPAGLLDPYREGKLAPPVTFGKTPSDRRGDDNAVSVLRRFGVNIPHAGRTAKKEER